MIGLGVDTIFFLGAGASVKAGVPDTFGLVETFKAHVSDQAETSQALTKILEILEDWKRTNDEGGQRVDIELLLETLERLDRKDKDILLKFYEVARYKLSGYSEKRPIITQLKDFVKAEGIVPSENISYLEHFLGFVTDYKPLDIFSVNYDISVEQFCNTFKTSYTDGFDNKWNPKLFEENRFDIRLYKLHGSIMWYRTDRGDYVKIPTLSRHSETELITGERADTLMLYPMRKWEYAEPLLELLLVLKRRLENAGFVIVVGYSFRDDHIRNIFWDAAIRNPKLNIILISPSAHRIYKGRLMTYEATEHQNATKIPSALKGRVVCLPYKFEDVFSELRKHYAYRLREGLNLESAESRKEIRGEETNWTQILKAYVDCNHMEKVQDIETKIDMSAFFTVNPTMMVDLTVGAVVNYSSLEDYEQARRWYDRMRKLILYNPLNVEITQSVRELGVRAGFKIGGNSYLTFKQVYDNTRHAFKDFDFKKSIMPLDRLAEVGSQFEALQRLNRYLTSWSEQQDGYLTASKYIEKRRQHHANDIDEFGDRLREYTERLALPGRDQAAEIQTLMLDVAKRIEIKEIQNVFDVDR
jgi:tetratricopeptide (TPR) repeat protein